ncbi:MAG: cobalamin-dependent protein, partial [Clostridia bacterium]|nr:cobalamin-dependent protein [Clostridia bacterium]
VFPLVKKYGGAVVCLAMDEKSIPETPAGRAEVIGRIVRRAAEYGIPACDLIADGLVTTAATDPDAANKTLDTIELVKEKYGICSILGISNISFGLPEREKLNASFLSAALGRGLSSAIMNPLSAPVAEAYREFVQSGAYGEFAVGDTGVRKFDGGEITLKTAVVFGLSEQAAKEAAELAKTQPPMDIVNNELIPALDEVGADYESGKSFLPQLLMSADAAKSAFEEIKRAYAGKGEGGEKIVMATVQGDIHDIGKNIVKALLENYGYDVIDLGKDVPPETVLEAVERTGARLVGLSALMTTTVVNMEKTIRLLHEKAPQCKVMVGGAVLNEEYARAINADYYAADAVGAVKCAGSFFGVKE